jgi:hypothetical protein
LPDCFALPFRGTAPIASAKDYQYCKQDHFSGMRECGFDTIEQCVAMISGGGGSCVRDPYLFAAQASYAVARKGRGHRQRAD